LCHRNVGLKKLGSPDEESHACGNRDDGLAATSTATARSRDRGNDDQDLASRAFLGEVMPIARTLTLDAQACPETQYR
jgi:hypothetical protein